MENEPSDETGSTSVPGPIPAFPAITGIEAMPETAPAIDRAAVPPRARLLDTDNPVPSLPETVMGSPGCRSSGWFSSDPEGLHEKNKGSTRNGAIGTICLMGILCQHNRHTGRYGTQMKNRYLSHIVP